MKNNHYVNTNIIRRIARIWSIIILAIALIFLFGSLYNLLTIGTVDPYAVEDTHPPIIFLGIIGLAIAFRWEGLGSITTILIGILSLLEEIYLWVTQSEIPRIISFLFSDPLTNTTSYYLTPYIVSLFIVIPGILFFICWRRER